MHQLRGDRQRNEDQQQRQVFHTITRRVSKAEPQRYVRRRLSSVLGQAAERARDVERQSTSTQTKANGRFCAVGVVDDVTAAKVNRVLIRDVGTEPRRRMVRGFGRDHVSGNARINIRDILPDEVEAVGNADSIRVGRGSACSPSFTCSFVPMFLTAAPMRIVLSPGRSYCAPKSIALEDALKVDTLAHWPEQSTRYCSCLKVRPRLSRFPIDAPYVPAMRIFRGRTNPIGAPPGSVIC